MENRTLNPRNFAMAAPNSNADISDFIETIDWDSSPQNPSNDTGWEKFFSGTWVPGSGIIDLPEGQFRSPSSETIDQAGYFTPFMGLKDLRPPSGYHEVRYDDPLHEEAAFVDDEGECVRCGICYKAHRSRCCPHLNRLPQGEAFDRSRYEILCACGNVFNEDKWACTLCLRSWPVLKDKYCSICKIWKQHSSYECPIDKVEAAIYKSIRDEKFSKVPIPY